MNEFTKKELEYILECVSPDDSALGGGWHREPDIAYRLKDKIQSLIDNYQDEQEMYSCYTGLAVDDEFFSKKESMDRADILPAISELAHRCSGIITEPGIYAFKLRLVRLK